MINKSITELRGIAQAMGCTWGFGDDATKLIQLIETKRDTVVPPTLPIQILMPEDQRLRSKPPAYVTEAQILMPLIQPYIDRGLHFSISVDGQTWMMQHGVKSDSGTMRQPPRNVLRCAERIMQ